MIQDENSNFVNHYLNVFAYHSDEGISIQLKNQATLAMKVTLLLKAFEGYKDTGKAELFIVNDNTSGKIRVFSIANLISKIYKDIENYSNIILSGGSDISNLSLKNSRQATYSDRITKLIQDVHNHKITVSIPPSVLMEETSTLTE
jgi:hypothetical protein